MLSHGPPFSIFLGWFVLRHVLNSLGILLPWPGMGSAAGSAYGLAASSALSYMRSRPLLGILGGEKFHRALDEVVYLSYDAETTLQPNTTG